ncbi:MAG: hypothetical protein ABI190_10355, partial [Casimicrobiaceae bacterium]
GVVGRFEVFSRRAHVAAPEAHHMSQRFPTNVRWARRTMLACEYRAAMHDVACRLSQRVPHHSHSLTTKSSAHSARHERVETLALKYAMTRGRIIAEGLGGEILAAERKLAAQLKRVARILSPLGVTVEDLESVVERRLQERHKA